MAGYSQHDHAETHISMSRIKNEVEDVKRVLCIVSWLDMGGAETFLLKIYRRLPQNYKLDFIVSRRGGVYEEEVVAMGGNIFFVPTRTGNLLKAMSEIRKIVKNNRYDYILKLANDSTCVFDIIAAKRGGAKRLCVRACNEMKGESFSRKIIHKLLQPIMNVLVTVRISPSDVAARYLFGNKKCNDNSVHYINNGLDIDLFSYSEQKRENKRKELGISPDSFVVCHVGRFNYQKNHSFVLSIFESILAKQENSILLLLGGGELEDNIKALVHSKRIDNRVIFLGTRKDVAELLSAADALLLPSLFEGMPNVVIEAQAAGLPCYISDTITSQAKITNLVYYLSLNTSPDLWADAVINNGLCDRYIYPDQLRSKGYDIQSVTKDFISTIWGI